MNEEEKYKADIKRRLKECNAIQINIYLSRSQGKLFVAVDGNYHDMKDFGINSEQFQELGNEIDAICQKIVGEK